MSLAEHLQIRPGVTAVIGGGGKTTLLRKLGGELARQSRVLLCTTTKMYPYEDLPCAKDGEELARLRPLHRLICAGAYLPESGKITTLDVPMEQLAEWFDYVLVEADGAARRPLKAHATHEPVIPALVNQVICVVGASGFGKPISEVAHRAERYAQLAGVSEQTPVTAEIASAVLNAESFHNKIYVNQMDVLEDEREVRRLAALLDCPVVAGSLWKGEYVSCWL